jgi:stage V sporulation protein R
LFALADHADEDELVVDTIHNESGYRRLRKLLSEQHAHETRVPDVQIVRYDRDGDRSLELQHIAYRDRPLAGAASEVVKHLYQLWGFPVRLETWKEGARIGNAVECPA